MPNAKPKDELTNLDGDWRSWAATQPYDRRANEIEKKWGTLEYFLARAPAELQKKFANVIERMHHGITFGDLKEQEDAARNLEKGLNHIERVIEAEGGKPPAGEVWVSGKIAIARTVEDARIAADDPWLGAKVYSLDEAARIIEAFNREANGLLGAVKEAFPRSEVVAVHDRDPNDAVPL